MQSTLALPERLGGAGIVRAATDAGAAAIVAIVAELALHAGSGVAIVIVVMLASAAAFGRYTRSFASSSVDEIYGTLAAAILCGAIGILAAALSAHLSNAAVLAVPAWALLAAPLAVYATQARRRSRTVAATCERLDDGYRVPRTTEALIRALDVLFACIAIVLFAPVMLAAAIAIYTESGGPVLFRQERVGRGGLPFVMFKFRTMHAHAGSAWVRPGDRRITPLGALLRRTSVDELPQLFNVLRGEMSLVGPRPEMREYAERFALERAAYPQRHIVRPGITGWAQLHLARNLQPSDMPHVLRHDLFYVQNIDALLYVSCLVKTALEVLAHRAV